MNTETKARKEINELNEQFRKLHRELLENKMFDVADKLSSVYYKVQGLNYGDGIDFITELNKKY